MLKKLVISIISLFLLWGCKSSNSIDLKQLSQKIYEQSNKEMILLDAQSATDILFLEDAKECYVYLANDNSADIIALIRGDTNSIENSIMQYLDSIKSTSAMYAPQEITKIDNYLLVKQDDILIFVISDNIDNIRKIVEEK